MKVLQIIPSFGMGGAEKVVLNYLRAAKKNKWDFIAISLYSAKLSVYDDIIKKEGLDVIYLNKKKGLDLKVVFDLKREIRKIKPDIVHTHLYALKYYILTGEYLKYKNFHTIHSNPLKDAVGMNYWANRFLFSSRKATPIVLHEGLIAPVNEYYHINSAKVIENGIFVDEYKYVKENSNLKYQLGIADSNFVIGHVGKFKDAKNQVFLIELMEEILRKNDRAILLLIGDGELYSQMRKKVRMRKLDSKVIFCGNRNDIPELLKIMDVFVFPSKYEGLGLSLIEAQLVGIRCVASDAVPLETKISNAITYISLDASKDVWIKSILSPVNKQIYLTEKADRFDIRYTMIKLLELYKNE